MFTEHTSIGGNAGLNFAEAGAYKAMSGMRRSEVERIVKKAWAQHSLPNPKAPWHELTKADLEEMAKTLGILGDLQPVETPGVSLSSVDISRAREEQRQEIANMKHFQFKALANKLSIPIAVGITAEEKAAVVEQMLDALENL